MFSGNYKTAGACLGVSCILEVTACTALTSNEVYSRSKPAHFPLPSTRAGTGVVEPSTVGESMDTLNLYQLRPEEHSCTLPVSAPSLQVQHAKAFEPGADGWPLPAMDVPQCPWPRGSPRKAAAPLPRISLIYCPLRHRKQDGVKEHSSHCHLGGCLAAPRSLMVKRGLPRMEKARMK